MQAKYMKSKIAFMVMHLKYMNVSYKYVLGKFSVFETLQRILNW